MSENSKLGLSSAYQLASEHGRKPVQPARPQTRLDFRADGTVELTEVDANAVARRRKQQRELLRSDARRQAEYLATRGKTPIEALHDLVGLGWRRGCRELERELGISRKDALAIYERWATTLLPFTAARWDVMEAAAGLGAGIGAGTAAAHFLAARAMSDALALERRTPANGPAVSLLETSVVAHTIDASETPGLGSQDGGVTRAGPAGLPPKAAD